MYHKSGIGKAFQSLLYLKCHFTIHKILSPKTIFMAYFSLNPKKPSHRPPIQRDRFRTWVNNYKASRLHKNETRSGLIALEDLDTLLQEIRDHNQINSDNPINGVRIYLIRDENIGGILSLHGDGSLPVQMSFALRPTDSRTVDERTNIVSASDYWHSGSLTFGIVPGGEGTGLCPNNCGGSE